MAYEFKKITDTEVLTEVPETATVMVEINGEIKRTPGAGIGGGCLGIIYHEVGSSNTREQRNFNWEKIIDTYNKNQIPEIHLVEVYPQGKVMYRNVVFAQEGNNYYRICFYNSNQPNYWCKNDGAVTTNDPNHSGGYPA